jgi:hypothetical protein
MKQAKLRSEMMEQTKELAQVFVSIAEKMEKTADRMAHLTNVVSEHPPKSKREHPDSAGKYV